MTTTQARETPTNSRGRDNVLRRVYDWTMDMAERKNAMWVLGFVSFIESSIFPIPPDALIVPMVLADR